MRSTGRDEACPTARLAANGSPRDSTLRVSSLPREPLTKQAICENHDPQANLVFALCLIPPSSLSCVLLFFCTTRDTAEPPGRTSAPKRLGSLGGRHARADLSGQARLSHRHPGLNRCSATTITTRSHRSSTYNNFKARTHSSCARQLTSQN
jgi:hypothetical protein